MLLLPVLLRKLQVPHPHFLFPQQGQVTISNDGATLMKKLEIVHPAAKVLVDISLSQDAEVGRSHLINPHPTPWQGDGKHVERRRCSCSS